jgi:hypothetical protein
MPLNPQVTLHEFDNWTVYFIGPINPLARRLGARYIITMTKYLTRWGGAEPVVDCSMETVGFAWYIIFEPRVYPLRANKERYIDGTTLDLVTWLYELVQKCSCISMVEFVAQKMQCVAYLKLI